MFRVGDIITATDYGTTRYTITTHRSELKILDIGDDGSISVRVVSHKDGSHFVGKTFRVEAQHFKIVRRTEVNNRKVVA